MSFDQLDAMARLGAGELRGAYLGRKQRIELRARAKRLRAKNSLEKARIRADAAKEMANLETRTYTAMIAAQKAQARAKATRHAAGEYTYGERIGKVARGAADIGGTFFKGLITLDKPTRRRSARKSTRRRGK